MLPNLIKMVDDNFGYVYCMSNPYVIGYKVGRTKRKPEQRAADLFTTGVPTPFVIEFAKFVPDRQLAEKYLHHSLHKYRISDRREFFHCDLLLIRQAFAEIAGIDYDIIRGQPNPTESSPTSTQTPPTSTQIDEELSKLLHAGLQIEDAGSKVGVGSGGSGSSVGKKLRKKGLSDILVDGQRVRHLCRGEFAIAEYNANADRIVYKGAMYSISGFAVKHHREHNPNRMAADGWNECEYEISVDEKVGEDSDEKKWVKFDHSSLL